MPGLVSRFGRVLPCSWMLALAASACHPRGSEPPPDAEPTPPPTASADSDAPDREAILAASDLPELVEQPLADDPMGVTIHRLSNGMTVYISTDRQKPRFSAWIGVRAGSRMDPADSTGLAHYLEHMLFKGTDEYGTLDADKEAPHVERVRQLYAELREAPGEAERKKILAEIDDETQAMAEYAVPNEHSRMYGSLGVEGINAFTSFEQTVYVGDVPSNRLDAWATVEAERFGDPVFRLFYPELEAVYEEKNLSIDNPFRQVREALYAALYPAHPYGTQTTIGEVEHLKNPAYQDMVDYFERWYVPNNMAIALAGDVDAKTVLPVLEKTLGRGLSPKPVPPPPPGELPPLSGRVFREVFADGEEGVTLAWHAPASDHEDVVALEVMDRLLDDAKVGLLNVELELTQRVPSAGSYLSTLREAGNYVVTAEARAGQTPEELEAMLLEVIAKLKAGSFTEQDVTAVKLQQTVRLKRQLEYPGARVGKMMSAFIEHRQWSDVVDHDGRFQAVTRDDVVRVANRYLGDDYVVVAKRKGKPEIPKLDKPTITPVKIDPSRRSEFAQRIEAMPATQLEPEWVEEGKHYERRPLPAGDLITAVNDRNDLFSLTYQAKRGYRKDPYLCYALELLSLSGAGKDDAEAVQKELYGLGTSVRTSCNAETSSITVEGLDSQLEASLAVLDRWLADPSFDAQTLRRLHDNTVSERRDGMEKDWLLTAALGDYAKYGDRSAWLHHPSNQALGRARPAALRKLISSFLDHEHVTLYFGPRRADAVTEVVARGKRHRKTGDTQLREYRDIDQTLVFFLHKDGAKANVRFTIPRGPLPREQRPTARLLSEYLSGNMSALVFQEIRESRGLAYSASSNYSPGRRPADESSLAGFMSTQADKTPEAVRTFLGLLRTDEIQPERLVTAQAMLDQEYRATRIDPRWINRWVVEWDERGESGDPRPWEWKASQELSVADVAAFAKGFVGAPVIVVVVGDRERVGLEALAEIGKVQELSADELFSYGKFPPAKAGKEAAGKGTKAGKGKGKGADEAEAKAKAKATE
ncbi:MAG: insulinase family protein [Myxococcales bacterium]|nr:insulinase family protein [Myxococcales bacterium]